MSNFDERLKTANDRAKTRAGAVEAERAKKQAAEHEQAEKRKWLVLEWNARIAPVFSAVVADANKAMINSKFQLSMEPTEEPAILPGMKIVGTPRAGNKITRGMPSPYVEACCTLEGKIELVVANDPRAPSHSRMEATVLNREFIETKIADLVDALNP